MRIARAPLGAVPSAAALLGALAVLYGFAALAPGGLGPWLDPEAPFALHPQLRTNLVLSALVLFTHLTRHSEDRATRRDLVALRPHLALSAAEVEALIDSPPQPPARLLALVYAGGAGFGLAVDLLPQWLAGSAAIASAGDALQLVLMVLLFALLARRTLDSIGLGRLFSQLGRDHTRISLFDQEPLRVFGRRGLRLAINWLLGSAIASLLVFDASTPGLVLAIIALTLGLGVVSLVLPSTGVHQRLGEAKRAELRDVRAAIERGGAALRAGRDVLEAQRLPALIAYEGRVAAAREWPIDTPMLLRFAALAALATGSWLGGAVVERVLSSWLG